MSAMEGVDGQAAPATNGTLSTTNTDGAAATSSSSTKQHLAIAHITADLPNPSQHEIRGIITLFWPYSSLTQSLALNLAEKDVKLRSNKGQVKICFTGSLGKHVGAQGLGIDDELVLSLEGAEIVKTQPRDGRDVGWELRYAKKLVGRITNRETGDLLLDREEQPNSEVAPVVPVPVVVEVPSPPRSPPKNRVSAIQNDDGEWSSPAFIKRARLSYGSLMSNEFDAFIEDDGSIPGKGRKKARFEPRKSGTWRYQSESRSPSPEVEAEKQDTPMADAEPEKLKPAMMEQGCQTDDLPYNEAEIQEFFRQSQAIGREVRQDQQQHILHDEGVQTMFDEDEAEMFSPIKFPAASTTPFGNPPVPLFAQAQGSTRPFGEPPAAMQSTTPMEPLPEHYQTLVSPLASRSTAPVHQEGQWPSSMFESMGYRPASSLSRSVTSQAAEMFSPIPAQHTQQVDSHNSAALALEELSRIHHAQQVEDAVVEYNIPGGEVLSGSLNEVSPALSPPKQSMYPQLPEHTFLAPQQPSFGSRQRSPQQQSAPHSSRQSPYPADRYNRERSRTPQNRQTSPFQRAGSQGVRAQSETIDLTAESESDNGEDESEDEEGDARFQNLRQSLLDGKDDEPVMGEGRIPGELGGENFSDYVKRLQMAAKQAGEKEVEQEDEEEMSEVDAPRWRGQPSMIPKSRERVKERADDSDPEGESYEEGDDESDEENADEGMSEPDFGQRGVLLNPRPQVIRDIGGGDVDVDADGEAEDYDDEEELEDGQEYDSEELQSGPENGAIDPDLAAMPGSESDRYYSEEEEMDQEQYEMDQEEERYARNYGEAQDMGPAYEQRRAGSRDQSQSNQVPVVIDLLSDSDDEPAPAKQGVAKSSPPPTSQTVHAAQQFEHDSYEEQDEQLKVEADEEYSSDEEPGHENATEIAEHEREVYDEEHEDDSMQSFHTQEERVSPMSPAQEDFEGESGEEESGYQDEDATGEEMEPQDIGGMDGSWESKPVRSSPAKPKSSPFKKASSTAATERQIPEKVESIEPPAQGKGEDADVEDEGFEVPAKNFDVDPALLAERDEDRPVQASQFVNTLDSNAPATQPFKDVKADDVVDPASKSNAAAQLATAALLAERDEDRPLQPFQTAAAPANDKTEAAELAIENRIDEEVDADLRASRDMELTEEAEHDIEMAEVVNSPVQDCQQSESLFERFVARGSDAQDTDIDLGGEAMVKAAVEPGPRGDPEDFDMDGDIMESDESFDTPKEAERESMSPNSDNRSAKSDTTEQAGATNVVPAVIIDENSEIIVAEDDAEVEDEYEDPSSQLFEEMSYIEQIGKDAQPQGVVEEMDMDVEKAQQVVDDELPITENTQTSVQDSQQTVEASVFSQDAMEAISFQTAPPSQPQGQTQDKVGETEVAEPMTNEPTESETIVELDQGTTTESKDETMAFDEEEHPARHTRSHDKQPSSVEVQAEQPSEIRAPNKGLEQDATSMDIDEHPASHTRSHDKQAETAEMPRSGSPAAHTRSHDKSGGHCVEDDKPAASQDEQASERAATPDVKTLSAEEDEQPASHTRSHDKRVEQLQQTEESGSPAEHTRSHDALAGHCVEDEESAKGLQESTKRKSSSRKSTDQTSEENTPSKAAPRAVAPVVEIPVTSSIENVHETPPKRVTRSRRGTQESIKPISPPTRRALTPVVEVPVSTIEELEEEPAEQPEPAQRVTRSRQGTAEPTAKSPPRTRKTRRRSLTPVVEVPVSSIENVQEEPQEEPPQRVTRARKASNQSMPKPASPPRTRRMSQRSHASPEVKVSQRDVSMELEAIDEEEDELPDPGAEALLAYDDSPQKVRAIPPGTSAPAPARNLRTRRNASPELESSAQAVFETPIKTRARTLRSLPQNSQASTSIASSQLATGLSQADDEPHDPSAEALLQLTSPAAPQTPINKNLSAVSGSPSTWHSLTPTAASSHLTKTLRTTLPSYTPLKSLKTHLKRKIDVLCICVSAPAAPAKSKHTPYDWCQKLWVTEPGSGFPPAPREVAVFHRLKRCLPIVGEGEAVLLRGFEVHGREGGGLRSVAGSSWAVWKEGAWEMRSDVPLEFEGGEEEYVKELRVWWGEKVPREAKEKIAAVVAQKSGGAKK